MKKIFIDGSYGTVGLTISNLIYEHPDFEQINIAHHNRKDASHRKELIEKADLVVLCLHNRGIKEAITLIRDSVRVLDCSTTHRCDEEWTYGLPELRRKQRQKIMNANRVANPGCFASAFILALRPLVKNRIINKNEIVTAFGLTGYSAGGKRMMMQHEAGKHSAMFHALGLKHKHLPEMKRYTGLPKEPLFVPAVGTHKEGLILTIPLPINSKIEDVIEIYNSEYAEEPFINIHEKSPNSLRPAYPFNNKMDIYVNGQPGSISVTVKLNNLLKGAAGNAMQCINLMMGLDECTGLN